MLAAMGVVCVSGTADEGAAAIVSASLLRTLTATEGFADIAPVSAESDCDTLLLAGIGVVCRVSGRVGAEAESWGRGMLESACLSEGTRASIAGVGITFKPSCLVGDADSWGRGLLGSACLSEGTRASETKAEDAVCCPELVPG